MRAFCLYLDVLYKIYADEELTSLLASVVTSDNRVFTKHGITPCSTTIYYLTAVDASGDESLSTVVTIS